MVKRTNKLESDETTGAPFDAAAYEQPIGPELDGWGRIMARVQDSRTPRERLSVEIAVLNDKGRYTATRTETISRAQLLASYVQAMHDEQRADGVRRGACLCDLPWCGRAASHRWVRTAAELKAIRRKHKGIWLEGAPESTRCETHVPVWRVAEHRSIRPAILAVAS